MVEFCPKWIIITSNQGAHEWYKDPKLDQNALKRRISGECGRTEYMDVPMPQGWDPQVAAAFLLTGMRDTAEDRGVQMAVRQEVCRKNVIRRRQQLEELPVAGAKRMTVEEVLHLDDAKSQDAIRAYEDHMATQEYDDMQEHGSCDGADETAPLYARKFMKKY